MSDNCILIIAHDKDSRGLGVEDPKVFWII